MGDETPASDTTAARAAAAPLIPHRDWKLGQSDWLTAGLMWGAVVAVFAITVVPLTILFGLAARAVGNMGGVIFFLTSSVGVVLAGAAVLVAFMRSFTMSRQAWFARLSGRLKRNHPWARVRVRAPAMRVAGLDVLTGRSGIVALTHDRAVLVVRRIPGWATGAALGIGFFSSPFLDPQAGAFVSMIGLTGGLVLTFFTGADVHEVRYDDIDHVDAGEGRVQWSQRGGDAPRVVRFRVLDATDPGAASVWLTGDGDADSP